MTKKDYILLAEVIKRHKVSHDFLVDLSNALYMDNDRFNTVKFLQACGDC